MSDDRELSHLDERGQAKMVDVGDKPVTRRLARARGYVVMQPETRSRLVSGALPKGEAIAAARLAGIMAAKRCGELIPLCHPLGLDSVNVEIIPDPADAARVQITATATVNARTGVEMEALTAVSVAALTIYDMAKAVDRTMRIDAIRLIEKRGGKSDWEAPVEA